MQTYGEVFKTEKRNWFRKKKGIKLKWEFNQG
jgi:hypothetical protein